jgi:hypothetical protein
LVKGVWLCRNVAGMLRNVWVPCRALKSCCDHVARRGSSTPATWRVMAQRASRDMALARVNRPQHGIEVRLPSSRISFVVVPTVWLPPRTPIRAASVPVPGYLCGIGHRLPPVSQPHSAPSCPGWSERVCSLKRHQKGVRENDRQVPEPGAGAGVGVGGFQLQGSDPTPHMERNAKHFEGFEIVIEGAGPQDSKDRRICFPIIRCSLLSPVDRSPVGLSHALACLARLSLWAGAASIPSIALTAFPAHLIPLHN